MSTKSMVSWPDMPATVPVKPDEASSLSVPVASANLTNPP
jgi:hypothetical protein